MQRRRRADHVRGGRCPSRATSGRPSWSPRSRAARRRAASRWRRARSPRPSRRRGDRPRRAAFRRRTRERGSTRSAPAGARRPAKKSVERRCLSRFAFPVSRLSASIVSSIRAPSGPTSYEPLKRSKWPRTVSRPQKVFTAKSTEFRSASADQRVGATARWSYVVGVPVSGWPRVVVISVMGAASGLDCVSQRHAVCVIASSGPSDEPHRSTPATRRRRPARRGGPPRVV